MENERFIAPKIQKIVTINQNNFKYYEQKEAIVDMDFTSNFTDVFYWDAQYSKSESNNIFTHTLTVTTSDNILEFIGTKTLPVIFFNSKEDSWIIDGVVTETQTLNGTDNFRIFTITETNNRSSMKLSEKLSKLIYSKKI